MVFSTGAKVLRVPWFDEPFIEELSLDPKHVRLKRFQNGAPILAMHSRGGRSGIEALKDQVGVIRSAETDGKKGTAKGQFSAREDLQWLRDDVRDGIIQHTSVGYRVHKFEEIAPKKEGGLRTLRAVDWEPFENSIVTMGADDKSMVRNETSNLEYECEIITRGNVTMPENKAIKAERERVLVINDLSKSGKITVERASEMITAGTTVDEVRKEAAKPAPEPTPEPTPEPVQDAARTAEPVPEPAKEPVQGSELVAERERVLVINDLSRLGKITGARASEMITAGTPVDEARKEAIENDASEDAKTRTSNFAGGAVVKDQTTRKQGIENSLLHRVNSSFYKLEDIGKEYRGMTMMEIARECLEVAGQRTRGLGRMEIASRAMNSSSDFPIILADVANKTLRDAYAAVMQTFETFVRRVSLNDFKPVNRVQLGALSELEQVKEHGEYKYSTLSEAKEFYALGTYGKIIAFTRKMLVNDDLQAFSRVVELFGRRVRDLESTLVYNIITGNPVMGDGKTLFHADHGNLAAAGSILSIDSISKARLAMQTQTGIDDEEVQLEMMSLLVPATLRTKAQQLTSQISPVVSGEVNPFVGQGVLSEARLDKDSALSWYGVASPAQIDTIELAGLVGEEAPVIETRESFDVDGLKIKCRVDRAAKAIDWRGFYKNPGA